MLSCKEIGRLPPTFADASSVAQDILDSGYEYDNGSLFFNTFKLVLSMSCLSATNYIPKSWHILASILPQIFIFCIMQICGVIQCNKAATAVNQHGVCCRQPGIVRQRG